MYGRSEDHAGTGQRRHRARLRRFLALRQAEIEDLHRAAGGHHDVRRFQIAMNDASRVRAVQRLDDVAQKTHGLRRRQARRGNQIRQRTSRDQFHRDVIHAIAGADVIDRDDAMVVQRRCGDRFTEEPR